MSTSEPMRRPIVAAIAILAGALLAGAVPAAAESQGPFVALDKAKDAAAQEGNRAHAEDATAATLGAAIESPPAAAPAKDAAEAPAPAPAKDAAEAPAAATAPAAAPGDAAKNDAAAAAPGAAPADAAAKPQEDATVATASYDAAQHRDPFRPPSIPSNVADSNGPRTPLEGYDIGQLKLVGIVSESGASRAMVEDSSGLGYIVTTGTPIGTAGGVVTSIEPRRVLIEEHVTNFFGEKEPKQVVMELPKEDRSP